MFEACGGDEKGDDPLLLCIQHCYSALIGGRLQDDRTAGPLNATGLSLFASASYDF
jgi:hypothetical protein